MHVFVGLPQNARNSNPQWDEANYHEMGEAPFRDTTDTSKQVEKKTIYVNAKALFIKLRFPAVYGSRVNKTGQVGVMGVKVTRETNDKTLNRKVFGYDRDARTLTMDPFGDGGTVGLGNFSDG